MSVPLRRLLASLLGLAALGLLVAIVMGRHSDPYRVVVQLDNASGLRPGSVVQAGGVDVGKIADLQLGRHDNVEAVLDIAADKGPIGRGSRVQIKAKNLLGEKYIQLTPGDRTHPAPSGVVIPAADVTEPVDLDQLLGVLDLDTRAKLKILVNEAGASLAGRGSDLNAMLAQLPTTVDAATNVLEQVVGDNHTLGDLIDRSDRFIATFAQQRRVLTGLVDRGGQTAATVATRDRQLRQTLAGAPGTVRTLRQFLDDLRSTASPLGAAAHLISNTAPPLQQTLDAVPGFQQAAAPTLEQAIGAAPHLTRLGVRATPVVRRATPTLTALATFGTAVQPVSRTLNLTIDDLMAVLQGWSRAIQGRDGLNHVFRAKVGISVDSLRAIVSRLASAGNANAARKQRTTKPATPVPDPAAPAGAAAPKPPNPATPQLLLPKVPQVQKTADSVRGLLDFLLHP